MGYEIQDAPPSKLLYMLSFVPTTNVDASEDIESVGKHVTDEHDGNENV